MVTPPPSALPRVPPRPGGGEPLPAGGPDALFAAAAARGGSDLHLKPGTPPRVRVQGELVALPLPPLSAAQCEAWVLETMDPPTRARFAGGVEVDYAITVPGVGRWRANAFRTCGLVSVVARRVGERPRRLDDLGLPPVVGRLALEPRGLVLVTGPTGSGKTTTLAAMVDLVNQTRPVHIVTIEDPVEVLHVDQRASVSQRELGTDTTDFATALRAAMRQDPDVILIGEMRDPDTTRAALAAAETGHFVLSSLHTTDATDTVHRVIDFFPPHEQRQVRLSLAQSLKGVVCQRLLPAAQPGGERVCAVEVLVGTERVAQAIADPDRAGEILDLVADGGYYGMQTFDQHLVALVGAGRVSVAAAQAAATAPHDMLLQLRRAGVR